MEVSYMAKNHKLNLGDFVQLPDGRYGSIYKQGRVSSSYIILLEDEDSQMELYEWEFRYVPPYEVSADEARKLFRGDIELDAICARCTPMANYAFNDPFKVTLDDLQACLDEYKAVGQEDMAFTYDHVQIPKDGGAFANYVTWKPQLPYNDPKTEDELISMVIDLFCFSSFALGGTKLKASVIEEDIEKFREGKPIHTFLWADFLTDDLLYYLGDNQNAYDDFDEETKQIVHNLIEDEAYYDNPLALDVKAYGYYLGACGYEKDYVKAKEMLEDLLDSEISDERKVFYCNTLGYIYYYGTANDGETDSDEAFHYFSLASNANVDEATVKLSDMYHYGYGVPYNDFIAVQLLKRLYKPCEKEFLNGNPYSKLADVAIRVADLYEENDLGIQTTCLIAYRAILERLPVHYVGDKKVWMRIRDTLDRFSNLKHPKTCTVRNSTPGPLQGALEGHACHVAVYEGKNENDALIEFERLPDPDEVQPQRFFLMDYEHNNCEAITKGRITAHDAFIRFEDVEDAEFIADSFEIDGDMFCLFHHGKLKMIIACDEYSYQYRTTEKNWTRHRFVETDEGTFLADNANAAAGDMVILEDGTKTKVRKTYYRDMNETEEKYLHFDSVRSMKA